MTRIILACFAILTITACASPRLTQQVVPCDGSIATRLLGREPGGPLRIYDAILGQRYNEALDKAHETGCSWEECRAKVPGRETFVRPSDVCTELVDDSNKRGQSSADATPVTPPTDIQPAPTPPRDAALDVTDQLIPPAAIATAPPCKPGEEWGAYLYGGGTGSVDGPPPSVRVLWICRKVPRR